MGSLILLLFINEIILGLPVNISWSNTITGYSVVNNNDSGPKYNLYFNKRILHSGGHGHGGGHSGTSHGGSISHHYSHTTHFSHKGIILFSSRVVSSYLILELIRINNYPYYDNILSVSNETHSCNFRFDLVDYNFTEIRDYLQNYTLINLENTTDLYKIYCYPTSHYSGFDLLGFGLLVFIVLFISSILCCVYYSNDSNRVMY